MPIKTLGKNSKKNIVKFYNTFVSMKYEKFYGCLLTTQ